MTEIVRAGSREVADGPADWFTGEVRIEPVGAGDVHAARVTFAAGARTAWHTHPNGQGLHVESGVCRVGRDDGTVERLSEGDAVWFAPGERHWHGAAPDGPMTHLAIQRPDESGSAANWGEHVTDEQYGA
jgi:quercetin dioxygenase-like cupin family protein